MPRLRHGQPVRWQSAGLSACQAQGRSTGILLVLQWCHVGATSLVFRPASFAPPGFRVSHARSHAFPRIPMHSHAFPRTPTHSRRPWALCPICSICLCRVTGLPSTRLPSCPLTRMVGNGYELTCVLPTPHLSPRPLRRALPALEAFFFSASVMPAVSLSQGLLSHTVALHRGRNFCSPTPTHTLFFFSPFAQNTGQINLI
ncbi:hypothetical protein AOQ84DRAFT_105457 [Glonium stellatum]|uniref:Uncharacterized protein n=1 Tax=Glonium stellatum TaxID=574774 RepID=A0A8E2EU76_9PEZI|nr:hypothetical protein AOQ84DRAFT_105457 [Glonium stellatum]